MLRLVAIMVSIGLGDSLDPATVAPALYMAAGDRPRSRVLRFTAGVAVVFFVAGAALMVGPGQALVALVPRPGPRVRYIAETVAGVAILIGSVYLWRHRRQLAERERKDPKRNRRRSPAWLGVTIAAVELPTAFPYFAGIGAAIAAGLSVFEELLLIGIYTVCMVSPLLAIAVTLTVAGDQASEILERARAYLHARWPVLLAMAALAVGIFVTLLGVTGLLSTGHSRVGHFSRRLHRFISR